MRKPRFSFYFVLFVAIIAICHAFMVWILPPGNVGAKLIWSIWSGLAALLIIGLIFTNKDIFFYPPVQKQYSK